MSMILEYWRDDGKYIGRLKGAPGVFSQGESVEELEENIRDAYQLMLADDEPAPSEALIAPPDAVQVEFKV
jgi:predicted RNase H-like HicB family nuclease